VASKTFPCGQCDFKAKGRKNLKKHMESEHLGIKPLALTGPIDYSLVKNQAKKKPKAWADDLNLHFQHQFQVPPSPTMVPPNYQNPATTRHPQSPSPHTNQLALMQQKQKR
jgi:hypothetical protein